MISLSRRKFLKITGAAAGIATAGTGLVRAAGPASLRPAATGVRRIPTTCDICFWKCGAIASVSAHLPFYHPELFLNVDDPPAHLRISGRSAEGFRQ